MNNETQDIEGADRRRQWPDSIEAAVAMLRAHVPAAEQSRIAALPREGLIELHFDLGAWVRSTFGLSTGNDELLEATGSLQPNDACDAVIEAFWIALQSDCAKVQTPR